jgi:transposase InsO family protein
MFPELPRRELLALLYRARRHLKQERLNDRPPTALIWTRPRSVWAIDYSEPISRIDGRFRYLLNITDLATGRVLLSRPCRRATAANAAAGLEELYSILQPPLVLKLDNGSHFTAKRVRRLNEKHQVTMLFSPPYTPEYNGAIEARNGTIKTWAADLARLRGHAGRFTSDDIEGAVCMINQSPKIDGYLTPDAHFLARPEISQDERTEFLTAVSGARRRRIMEWLAHRNEMARLGRDVSPPRYDILERKAIADALQECRLLYTWSAPVRQPIPKEMWA